MVAAVETMAYTKSGGLPWHGLGNPVRDDMTPKEMLTAAGILWTVSKHKVYWKNPITNVFEPVDREYVLARDTDQQILSSIGEGYKPVQNEAAAEFFLKFTKAGHMTMETAGSLWDGKYIWCLARVNRDFAIGKGSKADEIRSYLRICSPHVRGKALVIQFTPIRVVCWNTLTYALGASLKGKGNAFRIPHSQHFNDDTKKRAEEALGIAQKQMDEFKDVVTLLSKKKATPEKTEEFFCEVLQYNPKTKMRRDKPVDREPVMLPQFRQALTYAPGHDMTPGTWWSNVNAVTYVIDHDSGKDRGTALKNAWLGHLANVKRDAMELAVKYAK